jgi:hypothetical protein
MDTAAARIMSWEKGKSFFDAVEVSRFTWGVARSTIVNLKRVLRQASSLTL